MRYLLALMLCLCLVTQVIAEERKFTRQGSLVTEVSGEAERASSKSISEWLVQAKTARSAENRHAAASALQAIASREVEVSELSPDELDSLRKSLKTCAEQADAGVQFEGIHGLTMIGNADYVPVFAAYLAKNQGYPELFEALGRIGDVGAVKLLVKSLNDPRQMRDRSIVAISLGQTGSDEAAKALEAALKKVPPKEVRFKEVIEQALDAIDEKNSKKVKF